MNKEDMNLLKYLIRYKTKEILGLIVIVLITLIIILNVSYDKKNGLRLNRINVNIEVKK